MNPAPPPPPPVFGSPEVAAKLAAAPPLPPPVASVPTCTDVPFVIVKALVELSTIVGDCKVSNCVLAILDKVIAGVKFSV